MGNTVGAHARVCICIPSVLHLQVEANGVYDMSKNTNDSMFGLRQAPLQSLFQFIPKAFSYTSAHPSKTFSDPFLCTGKRKGPSPNCFHKIVSVLLAIM